MEARSERELPQVILRRARQGEKVGWEKGAVQACRGELALRDVGIVPAGQIA